MKKFVNAFDYAGEICKAMPQGILMTTKVGEKVNTMTIGWGTIGIQWGKPVFIAFVRDSRHTMEMLNEVGEFTVNVPMGDIDKKILGYCGTKSGRDTDKIADMAMTLEAPEVISVPGIKELPLTLECKVIYRQRQENDKIPADLFDRYYPAGDFHTAFYGEIVSAYVIE